MGWEAPHIWTFRKDSTAEGHLTKSDYSKGFSLSRFLLAEEWLFLLLELSDSNKMCNVCSICQSLKKRRAAFVCCFHIMLQRVPSKYWFCKTMHYVPTSLANFENWKEARCWCCAFIL